MILQNLLPLFVLYCVNIWETSFTKFFNVNSKSSSFLLSQLVLIERFEIRLYGLIVFCVCLSTELLVHWLHVGLIFLRSWLRIIPNKFSSDSWLIFLVFKNFMPALLIIFHMFWNPRRVKIQFFNDGMHLTDYLIFGSTYRILDSNLIAYNQKSWCLLFSNTATRKGLSGCKVCAFTESKSLLKKSNTTAVSYPALFDI